MTSGIFTYSTSANDIIKEALLLCRAYDPNQTLQAEDQSTGLRYLNMLIKHWQTQGNNLWLLEDCIVFLEEGKRSYFLGPNGDHSCKDTDFIHSEIANDAVAAAESVDIDDSSGMLGATDIFASNQAADINAWTATNANLSVSSDELTIENSAALAGYAELLLTGLIVGNSYRFTYGYEVGTSSSATFSVISDSITLVSATQSITGTYTFDFTATQTEAAFRAANDSTTINHTTIVTAANYVDKSTGDYCGVELNDGTRQWLNIVSISGNTLNLNGALNDDSDENKTVYTYSEKIEKPLRMNEGRFQARVTDDEIPVNDWSRSDYMEQTQKDSQGTVTNMYYQPKRIDGRLYVWQVANDVKNLLRASYSGPFEVFVDTSDKPDIPTEWFLTLSYCLAVVIAPQYKTNPNQFAMIKQQADEYLEESLGFDNEHLSMFLEPDFEH